MRRLKMLVALSGPIGSGKSTLSRALCEELRWPMAGFGSYVRAEARARGLPDTRPSLQDLGDYLPREMGWEAFCRAVLDQIAWTPGRVIIVDGVRHREAVEALQVLVLPAPLIHVHLQADLETRRARLRAKGIDYADAIEAVDGHATEAQVPSVMPALADLILDSSRPLGELVDEVVRFVGVR